MSATVVREISRAAAAHLEAVGMIDPRPPGAHVSRHRVGLRLRARYLRREFAVKIVAMLLVAAMAIAGPIAIDHSPFCDPLSAVPWLTCGGR